MMRVLAISTAVLLLVLALLPLGTLSDGGIDPRVPADLYDDDETHPVVEFPNATFEVGTDGELDVRVGFVDPATTGIRKINVDVALTIYRWGVYGEEKELEDLGTPLPKFRINDTIFEDIWMGLIEVEINKEPINLPVPDVSVPAEATTGYYRIRVLLEFDYDDAQSMGYFTAQGWADNIDRVRRGEEPIGTDWIVSEAGFTVVPVHFEYISQPNKVPDFGNFTTPVIRPGDSGTYNFTVTNRYNLTITDVFVTVEFYMWATIDDAKPIEDLDGPVPVIKGIGEPGDRVSLGRIDPGSSKPVRLDIATEEDTPKGTYFVRHRIEFQYNATAFVMESRGFFTWDQWEGFDYTNLYYQLGTAGIVPDSSFSVKDPVPLWPLATLIVLCILLGSLAVVFYLAEEHGDQYPRLKKGLQYWSGKYQQRKRLMKQRLEDIRADQEAEDDDLEDD